MLKKIIFMAFLSIDLFAMHSAELNINDKDLELAVQLDVGQFNENVEPDTTFIGVKFLNVDKKYSSNKYFSNEPYYEANFLTKRSIEGTNLRIGMGVKVNYTKKYTTVPLGLSLEYAIAKKTVPMNITAEVNYAPSSLSFADADSFLEYRVAYDIEIIKNGHISLGYRSLDTNYKGYDYSYNKAWYVGFKFGF